MKPQPHKSHYVALAIGLGAAGFVLPWLTGSPHFNAAVYLVASSLFTLELLDVGLRIWFSRIGERPQSLGSGSARRAAMEPYAILLSVHDLQSMADRALQGLERYKARTWIIDDCSNDATVLYLQSRGWRCLTSQVNRKKPGALKALLARIPAEIRTVVVLDPDSAPLDSGRFELPDLENALVNFQASGAAACCPRIRLREDGPLVSFQVFECELAFTLGRKGMMPHCITSGVSIYDRAALASALEAHSLSVYAEDLENSVILLSRGRDIHFDDELVVETEGKRQLAAWFSQRVGWAFGLVRVCATRWREILVVARRSPWAFYNLAIYMVFMTVVLLPVKLAGILVLAASFANAVDGLFGFGLVPETSLTDPSYFAATYLTYTAMAVCLTAYLRPPFSAATRVIGVSFYLFYAAANAVAMGVGCLNWLSVRFVGRRIYRDHYSDDEAHTLVAHDLGVTR